VGEVKKKIKKVKKSTELVPSVFERRSWGAQTGCKGGARPKKEGVVQP